MSKKFWDDEEEITENEFIEESEQEEQEGLEDQGSDIFDEVLEEEVEDELSESEIMANARLRLEQGRLYEMLMDHNLFEGVQADSRAVKNVEKEFKSFIKERLEILLGIREETSKAQPVSSPFTETEIQLLKSLIGRVMEKQGIQEPEPQPEKKIEQKQMIKPKSLNLQAKKPSAIKVVQKTSMAPQKPAAPVKKALNQKTPKSNEPKPLDKPPSEMTAQELLARARETSKRYIKTKPLAPTPMPTADQVALHYASRAPQTVDRGGVSLNMANVLSHLGASSTVEDVGYPGDDL